MFTGVKCNLVGMLRNSERVLPLIQQRGRDGRPRNILPISTLYSGELASGKAKAQGTLHGPRTIQTPVILAIAYSAVVWLQPHRYDSRPGSQTGSARSRARTQLPHS